MYNCLFVISMMLCGSFVQCTSQTTPSAMGNNNKHYTYKIPSADGIGKQYFGREISQVMGAGGAGWLERTERDKEENTRLTLDNIPVMPGGVIADIGAGTGYYSFKLVDKVPGGKVLAVEIQDELIAYLRNRKTALKDTVVKVIKGTENNPNLPDHSVDLVLMVDVYHELEFPAEMLQAIHRCLTPGGKILLIEYRGEDPSVPIKPLHKTTVKQLNQEMGANGFQLSFKGDFLPLQHFVMYEKIKGAFPPANL